MSLDPKPTLFAPEEERHHEQAGLCSLYLAGRGRFQELRIYTKAAVASGVTVDEIKGALDQITVYCRTPGGRILGGS